MTEPDRQRAKNIITTWLSGAHDRGNFETIKILFIISNALSEFEQLSQRSDRKFISDWLEGLKIPNERSEDQQRFNDWEFMKSLFREGK